MRLNDLVNLLKTASRPIDPTIVHQAAQRAANAATAASGGRYAFTVTRTPTGARITGREMVRGTPRELGQRAIRRMLEPELVRIRAELAEEGRRRLRG